MQIKSCQILILCFSLDTFHSHVWKFHQLLSLSTLSITNRDTLLRVESAGDGDAPDWVSLNQSLPNCQSFFFLFLSISLSFPLSLLLLSFSVFLSLKKVDVSIENSRFCNSISHFQVVWQFALNTICPFYNSQVTSILNVSKMLIFPLFDSIITDQWTNGPMDGQSLL